jgi:hypothetical protein
MREIGNLTIRDSELPNGVNDALAILIDVAKRVPALDVWEPKYTPTVTVLHVISKCRIARTQCQSLVH